MAYAVRAASTEDASSFARVLDDCCCCCSSSSRSSGKADGGGDGIKAAAAEEVVANGGAAKKIKATAAGEAPPSPTEQDAFERKIDAGSAELYFHCAFLCFVFRIETSFFLVVNVSSPSLFLHFFSTPKNNKKNTKQTTACSSTSKTCSKTTFAQGRTGLRSSRTR